MSATNNEKQRILQLAKDLVPHAFRLAHALQRPAATVAMDHRVKYPCYDPWLMFVYTMAGTSGGMITATMGPIQKAGKHEFQTALDEGRRRVQHKPDFPRFQSLFKSEPFGKALDNFLDFVNTSQSQGQKPADAAGTWVWLNVKAALDDLPDEFGLQLCRLFGSAIVREFGPYWLSDGEKRGTIWEKSSS